MKEAFGALGLPQPQQAKPAKSRKKWIGVAMLAVIAVGLLALYQNGTISLPLAQSQPQENPAWQAPPAQQPNQPQPEVKLASGDILDKQLTFSGEWTGEVLIPKGTRMNVQYAFDRPVTFAMNDSKGGLLWQVSNTNLADSWSRNAWSDMNEDMEYTLRFTSRETATGRIMITRLSSL